MTVDIYRHGEQTARIVDVEAIKETMNGNFLLTVREAEKALSEVEVNTTTHTINVHTKEEIKLWN